MSWKVLNSERIFNVPWLRVRKQKVQMPSGHIINDFYLLDYDEWVTIVPITLQNNIVLINQYRHGVAKIITELPAGCIEAGETPIEAAMRETKEETGYTFTNYIYLGKCSPNPSINTNFNHMVLALGGTNTGMQQLDNSEQIEPFEVSLQTAKAMLFNNQFLQAMHSTTLLHALKYLKLLV